ncbi:Tyrosine-protein phosphatase YwqE [Anaerohalosphaera lusitana]|uniref:protein-tyrosine-phosphatase n=1 Tax=Anaerohalosphaera lusitana TaxID=1936003 RepID=A0A1U9NK70_9BACT|nr:CpsB/CapC family capsule biosynthesis tyrosine phosphatase [Anaerohalosphaera lusitana]AQT68321.1 Tyrosine-protein phosphatase YwqE [Anaerohalosphaera lusitana]
MVSENKFIDIHCHCLPDLDDGPRNMAESIQLCQALVEDGVKEVIATPHWLGRYDGKYGLSEVLTSAEILQKELIKQNIPLDILLGAEVRIDERLMTMIDAGRIPTLGMSGKYLLLELFNEFAFDISPIAEQLHKRNIIPLIAHPERVPAIIRNKSLLYKWHIKGVRLQVTAESLTGAAGPQARDNALEYISNGWVAAVASDAHGLAVRWPAMKEAYGIVCEAFGEEVAQALFITNPGRIASGVDLCIIPPCISPQRSVSGMLKKIFG